MKVSAVALAYPTLVHVSSCPHHIPRVIPLVPISLSPFHQYPSPILIHLLCNCTPLPAVQYSTVQLKYYLSNIHYPPSSQQLLTIYNLSHTPEVHLNPLPKATCIILSPFLNGLLFCSSIMYSISYQMEEEEVFP